MAQDVEVMQDKPSNACCAALKKKYTKLLEKYSKAEELKKKFRECTELVQEKYNLIEKENESLKKALEEINLQANMWKDEKENEAGRRIDLEDEVSALQDEVRLLKRNDNSVSEEADKHLQERLVVADKDIKQLKELLDKEKERADLEKKNAELEKKKSDEALRNVEMLKSKVSEAQKVANAERKKSEEIRVMLEKLKKGTENLKSMLASEKSKSEAAERKVDSEKQNATSERNRADLAMAKFEEQRVIAEANLKKAMSEKDRADDLNRKLEEVRNKVEVAAAEKKLELERQKAIKERKRADVAVAKSEEQRKLAETNLKKAKFEKDRAGDLNTKLEEATNRAAKLKEEMLKHKCPGKFVEAQDLKSNAGRNSELTSDACAGMKNSQFSQWMEKMLLEKGGSILREIKCADLEKKKAKKQRKAAEDHKKTAMEQKSRADHLSRELEKYKLKCDELEKELHDMVSYRIYGSNLPSRNNDVTPETDTVKLLKKQLELERLVGKHAKKATKLEAFRNKMLHQELCHLKQECFQFQQRLDILDKSFLLVPEGINRLDKIGNQVSKGEMVGSGGYHSQLISGTDSRMDPPYGGSNQKMLPSSAINSSSASFSDRPLVGSQERGSVSIMTSANLGEDMSNCEPIIAKLSDKMTTRCSQHDVAIADINMRSPFKDRHNKRRVGAEESMKIMSSKCQKLNQRVSEKPSSLRGILNSQKDDPKYENLKETYFRELSRPCKKRRTSSEGTVVVHSLQKSGEPKKMLDSKTDDANDCMPASSSGSDIMKLHGHFKDGTKYITGQKHCPQGFDEMLADDYVKLLDLDNAADEDSYRRAIAMPLSPMCPEVEFNSNEKLVLDNPEMPTCRSLEGLYYVKDNQTPFSSNHVIESEKNYTNHFPSQLQTGRGLIDSSKNLDSLSRGDTSLSHENVIGSSHGGILKYFFVSSDIKDNSSILRIFQAIGSCTPLCSFINSAELFLLPILHTLLKAEDLSIKEKACVFFSLILHEICEVGLGSSSNLLSDNSVQIPGSVTKHINSVFCDPDFRRLFMESSGLVELLAVLEDFLLQGQVLVFGEVSTESEILHTSKANLTLNDNEVMLSEVVASAHLLIVGANLLALLCSAVDHIGFVCEVSCNIIRMPKLDPAVMLGILHAFAHISGSRYFTLQQYSLAMTVVKSLVNFLEKQILLTKSASFIQSEVENSSKIWQCTNCPFLDGAVSMENAAVLLLENLQRQCCSELCSQDSIAWTNFLAPRVQYHEDDTEEDSDLRESVPLSSTSGENLCYFIDILSLVEALASFMSWNWTSDNFIGKICEYLEARLMMGSSAAVIILLGQLGSLGVDTSGYDDAGVNKLRGWLSAVVRESTFMKLSLSVQCAIINSLFALTTIKLEDIVLGKFEAPAVTNHSIPASHVRDWFFSLTPEQQSFWTIHQATSESSC